MTEEEEEEAVSGGGGEEERTSDGGRIKRATPHTRPHPLLVTGPTNPTNPPRPRYTPPLDTDGEPTN